MRTLFCVILVAIAWEVLKLERGALGALIRLQEAKKCLVYKLELKCSFYSVFCSQFFFKDSIIKKIVYYFLRNNANRPAIGERRFVQNSGSLLTIPVTLIKTDYVGQSEYVHVGFHWSDSHTHCNIFLIRKNQKCSTWIAQNSSTWHSKGLNKNVLDC